MNTSLEKAIEESDLSTIKQAVKQGIDSTATNLAGKTALLLALEEVKNKQIYHWETSGNNGGTSVTYRVKNGLFTYLEEGKKCAFSLKDQKNCSTYSWGPVGQIAYYNAIDIVLALLKVEPNVHQQDQKGNTPIFLAAKTGEPRILKALLKLEADPTIVNNDNENIIHAVASSGRLDGMKVLFKKLDNIDINALDNAGWTALHYLMDAGDHPDSLTFLLDQPSIDPSISSTKEHLSHPAGVSALEIGEYRAKRTPREHEAYQILKSKYQLLATKKYLASGRDPNELSPANDSILSQVIRGNVLTKDLVTLLEMLLQKGADTNALDANQFNPLMHCLLKMMQMGEDLDKKKHTYYTQVATALIENGTDLSLAKPNSNQKVLRDAGDISEPIGKLIIEKLVKEYPNYIQEFNHQDSDGFTAVHTAARKGHLSLLKLMVKYGANINIPENYGFIPINEAIIANEYATVSFLLKNGADLTHTITEGYGPYESGDNAATIAQKSDNQKIAQLFT